MPGGHNIVSITSEYIGLPDFINRITGSNVSIGVNNPTKIAIYPNLHIPRNQVLLFTHYRKVILFLNFIIKYSFFRILKPAENAIFLSYTLLFPFT
ncbi:hypothetical protein XCR1_1040020 [Xenorhabdus cabanillasii JM26]|uniref:Uncharacterized protein n=1 Tax=Xenorhabdus cabanillasii JM26 TaxID=1427517 RepID=W1IPE0_9GAMM|nr:hypothetical protein XCR1_1040020 [Xenorhabdus cabanillasii JM26]